MAKTEAQLDREIRELARRTRLKLAREITSARTREHLAARPYSVKDRDGLFFGRYATADEAKTCAAAIGGTAWREGKRI